MTTQIFEIDGKQYKMFNLLIKGEPMNVASTALENKIQEMIDTERYHEVMKIDRLYGYYIPEEVEENEEDIRESIEDVIDIDE